MILALRTDSPTAELILATPDGTIIERESWLAERRLAHELLGKLESLLGRHDTSWKQLTGLVVFMGPGSFTGLRIGITVMNTIAYSERLPIVGTREDSWFENGTQRLQLGENDQIVLPEYGAPAHITTPRK